MNNGKVIAVIIGIALVAGIGFYLLDKNLKSKHNWNRTLELERQEPYDLHLFYETLKENSKKGFEEIPPEAETDEKWTDIRSRGHNGTYLHAGKYLYLSDAEVKEMLEYAQMGGTIFISSPSIPENLLAQLPGMEAGKITSLYVDTVSVQFEHPDVQPASFGFVHQYKDKKRSNYWNYFELNTFHTNDEGNLSLSDLGKVAVISKLDSMYPDFVYANLGYGKVYLHTNPVFFGNLYLQQDKGRKYLKNVMRHLPNQTIWFDKSAAIAKAGRKSGHTSKTIFSFIKENKSLTYAWWILCGGIVLFLAVGGRRKQRTIPVIKAPENHSLGLVESLGHFYFSENKNALVFKREWNQFLHFLRLHLHVYMEGDEQERNYRIAEKSGVALETINNVFSMHRKYAIFSELSGTELMEMNRSITQFYTEYYQKHGK